MEQVTLFFYSEKIMDEEKECIRIQQALTDSHNLLSKYYSFTDDYDNYLFDIILDPRFKTKNNQEKKFNEL